jgi:hypothetical protein
VPNARPKGVADGQQVNIPALAEHYGTLVERWVGLLDCLRAFTIPIPSDEQPRKPFSNRTKTDTGRRDEYSKALERTLVKELCKLTP